MDRMHHAAPAPQTPFWRSRSFAGLLAMGAVAAFFLLAEHRAHLLGALPFLIVLACPLIHRFVHRHPQHGADPGRGPQTSAPGAATPAADDAGDRP